MDGINGYTCNCVSPGYTGTHCETGKCEVCILKGTLNSALHLFMLMPMTYNDFTF